LKPWNLLVDGVGEKEAARGTGQARRRMGRTFLRSLENIGHFVAHCAHLVFLPEIADFLATQRRIGSPAVEVLKNKKAADFTKKSAALASRQTG
jgi:hypothetical protein